LLLIFSSSPISVGIIRHQNEDFEKGIILNPDKKENEIEFFMLKPEGGGPFPIIFLLDGYQPPESSHGGKQLAEYGYLDRFAKEGIVAVSISAPGEIRQGNEILEVRIRNKQSLPSSIILKYFLLLTLPEWESMELAEELN
jgi:hypothetical protein